MLATAAMLGTGSSPRPSAFEAVFMTRMSASFEPAFIFAFNTVAQHVRFVAPLAPYGDELFALLRLAVERYFVRQQDAAFAESFYGFARRPASMDGRTRMDSRDRVASLALLVGAPYLWRKLGAYCERSRSELEMERALRGSLSPAQRQQQRVDATQPRGVALFRRLLLALFPLMHTAREALALAFQLAYALKLSQFCSPAMRLLRLKLVRLSGSTAVGVGSTAASASASAPRTRFSRFATAVASGLKWSLVGTMIAFRMLQWVESIRERRPASPDRGGGGPSAALATTAGASSSLPPPPLPLPLPNGFVPGSCMLTKMPLIHPAVTPSGCVFNYQPLLLYVEKHGACPVSGQPLTVDDVRSLRP